MTVQSALLPLFAEVLLTFVLMFGMMYNRTSSLQRGVTQFTDIALREPNWPKRAQQFAYSFSNQFELPLLFYVLTVLAIITRHADLVFVVLAWIFVVFRILQAWIHVTTNNVKYRGAYYGSGALVLVVMWVMFMLRIVLGLP